jgi:hypothetical protein
MSEVIVRVARPLLDEYAKSHEDTRRIIGLVIAAWNLALVPEDERDEWRDKLLRDLCGRRLFGVVPLGTSREAADMFQWIFDFVALRKEALYPQVDHFIASFETEYTESGLRVNVMYTLDHPTVERID